MTTVNDISIKVRELLAKYNAESALLFGSYARGEATEDSDIDIIVFGGIGFKPTDIFAFAEDLREATGKDADVFEICEVNTASSFYETVMREGIKIA